MSVLLETWNIFSLETANVFCFSEVIESVSSWGTLFLQGISSLEVNSFAKEISNGIFWAK